MTIDLSHAFMRRRVHVLILATAATLTTAAPLLAQVSTYVGPPGGDWNTSTYWMPTGVPIAGDTVLFAPNGSGSYTYDRSYASPLATLTIGNTTGSSPTLNQAGFTLNATFDDLIQGTYNQTAGTLTGGSFVVGDAGGTGTYELSGTSTLTTGTLILGNSTASSGVASLTGGTLTATQIIVGNNGAGTLLQSGSSYISASYINVGFSGNGVFNMTGGTISGGDLENNSGTFLQSGSSYLHLNSLYCDAYANLSGGSVNASNIYVYGSLTQSGTSDVALTGTMLINSGTANLTGGTFSAAGIVDGLGPFYNGATFSQSGTSYVNLGSGSFAFGPAYGPIAASFSGGTFLASAITVNGTFTQSGTSYINLGSGSLNAGPGSFSGGTLLAGGLFIGDFYQSGTSFINLGSGTFYTNLPILNGGTLLAGTFFDQNLLNQGTASYISVGTLIIAANAATFSGTVTANYLSIASPSVHTLGTIFQNGALMNIGSLDIGSIGTLSMSAGTTNVTALNSAGTIAISGGKLALTAPNTAPAGTISAISISGTGVLDVGSSGIVIEYGSGTSPAGDLPYVANSGPRNYPTGSLQRAAQTGFNNYAWNGSGIISSYAANDSSGLTAVGIVDENDLGIYPNDYTTAGGGPGSWMGQPITDTNNVLVRMTWYGDGNDDGVVNKFDVAALAQGYSGLAGYIGWSDGDYTYAGSITRQDVSLLAQSYVFQGAPLGDAITPQQAQYLLALDPTMPANLAAAFEAIATPEPMSVGLLGTAGLLALTKRRRHSSI